MSRQLITHRDPNCTAGFSAVTGDRGIFDDKPLTQVELRCWSCLTRVTLDAVTSATEDPEYDDRDRPIPVPPQQQPRLAEGWGPLDLPASLPVEKVGNVYLHVEVAFDYCSRRDGHLRYLVTDAEGNVLGEVGWYLTARNALRYGWGTVEHVAGRGNGCLTPQQAARQLAKALEAYQPDAVAVSS